MKKLSVVIPAYNEEKMVPKTAKIVSEPFEGTSDSL